MSDKPFTCRIGLHSWYRDCAMFASVDRCNYCDAVADQKRADDLAAERARIDALPPNPSLADVFRAAAGR